MSNSYGGNHQRRKTGHIARFRQLTMVLVKYRLGEFIRALNLQQYLPLHIVPPGNPLQKEKLTTAERTRMALEEMGTTFIKIGQILSTRTDILPPSFTKELSKLQNSVKAVPADLIENIIKQELGRSVNELFKTFDPLPLGVASIGQVHAAVLQDGTEVVVKVQKPGVRNQVTLDLEILRQLASSAKKTQDNVSQYDLVGLVEEISDTLNGELNYLREGRSAEHFARLFQDDASIHIPKVYWQYTNPSVITLERIKGIGIFDKEALDAAHYNRQELAKRVVCIWSKMILENSVYHADPHPGNVFVEADGRLGLIDFGMIGLVDDEIRTYLVGAVKAILNRDVDSLIDSLTDLGATGPNGLRENLRKDLRHIMEHHPVVDDDISLAYNINELLGVIRRNRMRLPSNTFMLFKAMTMAQSLGRGLDKDFDFFATISPGVEELFEKTHRPSTLLRRLPAAIGDLASIGLGLPARIARIVKTLERGELQFRADVSGVERHLEHLERLVNRAVIGFLIAAIILAVAIIFLALKITG